MPSAPDESAAVEPASTRPALVLFVVALVLRIAAVFVLDTPASVSKGPWEFGYEAACIATSVHEGHGFSNQWQRALEPWDQDSGTTGWLAPLYPSLIAGLMSLAGGLTWGAALALFLIQCVLAALTCVFTWKLGVAMGVPRVGKLAGWALTLWPSSIWMAAGVVWDTTCVAFGVVVVLWAVFAHRRSGMLAFALMGAGFGVLLLVNPAPLVFTPALAWLVWRARTSALEFARKTALFAGCTLVVILPWLVRNERELGLLVLRTNLGVELDVGNNDEAEGRFQWTRHPSYNPTEFRRYRTIGEAAYARECTERARNWIAAHPRRFLELGLLRATFFWFGVNPIADIRVDQEGHRAISDPRSWIKYTAYIGLGILGLVGVLVWSARAFEARVLLVCFTLFPVVYCATHTLERYRYPIEPLLVLTGAWGVHEVWTRRGSRSLSSRP